MTVSARHTVPFLQIHPRIMRHDQSPLVKLLQRRVVIDQFQVQFPCTIHRMGVQRLMKVLESLRYMTVLAARIDAQRAIMRRLLQFRLRVGHRVTTGAEFFG